MQQDELKTKTKLLPVEKELVERAQWLITLRWIAAAGVFVTSAIARFIFNIEADVIAFFLIAVIILIYNSVCLGYLRRIERIGRSELTVFNKFANTQIAIDWVALIFLVHYSGGIESPLLFYFIFHVIIAAILLSKRACFYQATFASMLVIGITTLEYFNVISHIEIEGLSVPLRYHNPFYILIFLSFIISTLYISSFLATSVTSRLRQRDKELVALEEDLSAALEKLKALDKTKSEFMIRITHGLKSPISTAQSLLKVILEGYTGEVPKDMKDLIRKADGRMSFLLELVKDLLNLALGEEESLEEELSDIDMAGLIKKLANLAEPKVKGKEIELKVELPSTPLLVKSRYQDMELVLSNLLDNAIKYTPLKGRIRLSLRKEDKTLKFEIEDNGIGISSADIPKVFDEFYRAENAKAVEREGTGLGLPIVKKLVKKYGGEVRLESKLGEGSKFTVMLPIKE